MLRAVIFDCFGVLASDDFMAQVASLAKVSELAAKEQIEHNRPDSKLFNYIETELKPNYKIGLLSNAAQNWLADIFTLKQIQLFNAVALSCEMGAIKPEPKAYQVIADKLNVGLDECLFIDDQVKYCEGAEAVGMKALIYKTFEQFKREISPLL